MKRLWAWVVVVVGVTGACIAWAVAATLECQHSTRSALAVSSHLNEFENAFGYYVGEVRTTTLGLGISDDPSVYFLPQTERSIAAQMAAFERLETKYERHSRRTERLKKTRNAFRTVERMFERFVEFERRVIAVVPTLTEDEPESFDAYFSLYVSTLRDDAIKSYFGFTDAHAAFSDRILEVSTETSGTTVAVALVCAVAVILSAAVCVLVKLLDSADAKLAAQDKLARQQAHENRNKYAPAIGVLEQLLDAAAVETEPRSRGLDATDAQPVVVPPRNKKTDLPSSREGAKKTKQTTPLAALSDDIHLALVALREVEALHRSRLDCFKLLEGTYVSNPETFELLEFMRGRLGVERAVAQAHHRADFPDDAVATAFPVEYLARVEADGYRDCGALHVRCDLYVLNHVVQNLLSNSRKFTSQGRVVLTLRAATADREMGRLVFAVRDTGSGVPDAAIPKLFDQGVCTGDVRGTGLGLPSCSLFVKAAGGYIRLADTRRRGERHRDLHYPGTTPEAIAAAGQRDTQECADQASFSEFEFAVQGYVVRADLKAGPDDDDRRCEYVDTPEAKYCEEDGTRDADETDPELGLLPSPPQDDGRGRTESLATSECSAEDPGPETATALLPRNLVVVVVDDSGLNRRVLVRAIDKIRARQPAANWTYHQFETIEASQPLLRQLHCDGAANCLVCLDEQLGSRGGVLTGIEGARWLLEDLGFAGKIVSTSGDPKAGVKHLQLGTHLSWGKPLPDQRSLLRDLCTVFGQDHSAHKHLLPFR